MRPAREETEGFTLTEYLPNVNRPDRDPIRNNGDWRVADQPFFPETLPEKVQEICITEWENALSKENNLIINTIEEARKLVLRLARRIEFGTRAATYQVADLGLHSAIFLRSGRG